MNVSASSTTEPSVADRVDENTASVSGHAELQRKVRVLYVTGHNEQEIAGELAIDPGEVRELLKECVRNARDRADLELLDLEIVESEYREAWERSKIETKSDTGRPGNQCFLQGIERCIEKRKKIIEQKSWVPDEDDERVLDLSKATPEQMLLLSNLIHCDDHRDEQ